MTPIPTYYNSTMTALKPYMDVYYVGMWVSLLLMVNARTTRLRRIYFESLKRRRVRTWMYK
jgi:hypothetical protein